MSSHSLTIDFRVIERSTRRSIAISAVVHCALFLLLVLSYRATSETAGLTEITWLDAAALAPEAAAPPVAREESRRAPVEEVKIRAAASTREPERFERPLERADVVPRPQTRAVADIATHRAEALERDGTADRTRIASLVPPPKVGVSALAGVPSAVARPSGTPSALSRDDSPGGPPAALQRTDRPPGTPVAAVAVAVATPSPGKPAAPATSTSKRDLAGAQLVGPVADRPIVSYDVPRYPDWAKRDGVEGSVTLYFFVLPDGRVKENILVERTSGFSDFDTRASDALRLWRFKALPHSGEQWGRITFNYRLSDAR